MTPWAVLSIRKSIKGQGTPAHSWFGISSIDICIETLQTRKIYCEKSKDGVDLGKKTTTKNQNTSQYSKNRQTRTFVLLKIYSNVQFSFCQLVLHCNICNINFICNTSFATIQFISVNSTNL